MEILRGLCGAFQGARYDRCVAAPVVFIVLLSLTALTTKLAAQDLVDRKLFVEKPTGFGSSDWLAEIIKTAIKERGGPLLVRRAADADAVLTLDLGFAPGGAVTASVCLRDLLASEGSPPTLSKTYALGSNDSGSLIDELARPLAEAVVGVLPPLPQRILRLETVRTVESVSTIERARGARVGLRGPPGALLIFSDGKTATVGTDGVYDFGELPQNTDIVLTVSATGYHDTRRSFRVGSGDEVFELKPEAFERWGASLSWLADGSAMPRRLELSMGIFPRRLEASLGLLAYLNNSPIELQPDLGLAAQVLPEDWPFRIWIGLRAIARFGKGEPGFGLQTPLAAEFWLARGIGLRVEGSPISMIRNALSMGIRVAF
jgi:hypothetical protein